MVTWAFDIHCIGIAVLLYIVAQYAWCCRQLKVFRYPWWPTLNICASCTDFGHKVGGTNGTVTLSEVGLEQQVQQMTLAVYSTYIP